MCNIRNIDGLNAQYCHKYNGWSKIAICKHQVAGLIRSQVKSASNLLEGGALEIPTITQIY